ncbi:alpha/beta fold hydrolase [uncultured Psychroserpens sp.]|uniref:alpha/beta fold hydrolase n=1 Tax=uncultured Psychroserpens sp. TaxID=255436 RepID=UPI002612F599|nr:alpha/beta fold hydrolase [uncultured Psychroserpens sp.]
MQLKHLFFTLFGFIALNCQSQEKQHVCPFEKQITITHDRCGYVDVPNNWDAKKDGTTKIAYIVIASKSENRKDDPLVFIQGGPGGSVLPYANVFSGLALDPDRDFIMYDQRGIGFSNEICPNLSASFLEVMTADLSLDNEDETLLSISSECMKSLNDPNFKTAFGTAQSAKDLEALRQHLGYKQLNLFGGSYGTRLGLKYMELYPNSIRASILSGLFPLEIRLYENIYTNLNRSLEKLFDTCENDENCSNKYPNLKKDFEAICAQLDSKGQSFMIDGDELVINKQDFLLLIQQLLYDRQTIAQVPSFIMAFKTNDSQSVIQSIQAFASRLGVINVATYWSVNVKDEGAFKNKRFIAKDEKKHPSLAKGISLFASDPEVIKLWPSENNSNTKMSVVVSDIPTLLVSGAWDPITPPSNAEKAAKSLKNSSHVIFPTDGHCPMNSCFFQMAVSFLNNPMAQVDDSCTKSSSPIVFN